MSYVVLDEKGKPKQTRSGFSDFSTPSFEETGLSSDFRGRYDAALSSYDPESVKDSAFDRLVNFFGFRSSADKVRQDLNQSRLEAINQLVNQNAEQDYNSESSKSSRMREAGINPDLLGIGDASEATEGNEPENAIDFSQLVSGDDFIKSFSGAFSSAIAACSSIQGLLSQGIDIRNKLFSENDALQSKSWNILRTTNSLDELRRMFYEDEGYPEYSDSLLESYGLRSKRQKRFFRQFIASLKNSFEGQLKKYESYEDYIKAQDSFYGDYSKWYREGFDVTPALREFSIYEQKVREAGMKASESKSNYESKVYDKLNSDDAARAINNSNKYQGDYYNSKSGSIQGSSENSIAQFNATKTRLQKQLYDRLNSRANKGDIFAMMLLTQLLAGNSPIDEAKKAVDIGSTIGKFL